MKKNMGNIDRGVRVIVAAVLIGLYATNIIGGTIGIVAIAASVIFVLTSAVSFCPLYSLIGFSTCATK